MNKQVLIGIIITVLLIVVGGTVLFMRNRSKQASTSIPSSQVSPTEEPTPTPEAATDISQFKVKVLNGTAIAGLAAKVKTELEAGGFTVSSVGNADTKDYQAIEIQAKSTIPASVLAKLKDELKKSYTTGTDKGLDSKSEDDIVVILGTKSQPTAIVSPEITPKTSITAVPTVTVTSTVTPTIAPSQAPSPTAKIP